ncbi:MAG: DUF1573 domain-containing protein [Bacteroidales bacterium]
MKKTVLLTFFMLVFGVVFAQKGAGIVFDTMSHDFGTFSESKKTVSTTFTFKNTGKAPLVINRVVASCGCTTPEWSKEPIAPGKSGFVKATYNAVGRPGTFNKTITVFTNTPEGNVSLNIKGIVQPVKN